MAEKITESVKLYSRISTSKLDEQIQSTVNAGKAELIRLAVKEELVKTIDEEMEPLIFEALKTYALAFWSADKDEREGFMESFKYQADNLRKSRTYRREEDA